MRFWTLHLVALVTLLGGCASAHPPAGTSDSGVSDGGLTDAAHDLGDVDLGTWCGGDTITPNTACATGYYCHYDLAADCGFADAPGHCAPIPAACTAVYSPTCGCDGMTYGNPCEAESHGVSVQHAGPCEAPFEDGGTTDAAIDASVDASMSDGGMCSSGTSAITVTLGGDPPCAALAPNNLPVIITGVTANADVNGVTFLFDRCNGANDIDCSCTMTVSNIGTDAIPFNLLGSPHAPYAYSLLSAGSNFASLSDNACATTCPGCPCVAPQGYFFAADATLDNTGITDRTVTAPGGWTFMTGSLSCTDAATLTDCVRSQRPVVTNIWSSPESADEGQTVYSPSPAYALRAVRTNSIECTCPTCGISAPPRYAFVVWSVPPPVGVSLPD